MSWHIFFFFGAERGTVSEGLHLQGIAEPFSSGSDSFSGHGEVLYASDPLQ